MNWIRGGRPIETDGVADKRGIDGSDCQASGGRVVVNLRVVNSRHNYRDLKDLAYSSCLNGPSF